MQYGAVHIRLVDTFTHTTPAHNLPSHAYTNSCISTRLSSFFAFWRRLFKRKTTNQNEVKPKDHDQPQIDCSQELSESEDDDDDSSDQLSSNAAEPTESGSYRYGLI